MTKTNKMACAHSEDVDQPEHPPSLIRTSLCAQGVAESLRFLNADSEDSDQTRRIKLFYMYMRNRILNLKRLL